MNAMMPTIFFLLFAILPITCLMETTNVPDGCTKVNFDSFLNTAEDTLAKILGRYCELVYPNMHPNGTWIGITGQGKVCRVCCICKVTEGALYYSLTKAPNRFPCPNGKCNSKGKCIKKTSS
uniref:Putative salivary secreted protein n=1 Tax=Ixodes ricinus TaxID=34613 RepID=A0A6B0UNZ7_IXORI